MMNYFGMMKMKIIKRSRIDWQITEQRDYWETEWDPWGKAFKFLALCYTSTNKEKSGRREHNRENNNNKCCSLQASENRMQPTWVQRWTKVEFDLKNHLNWKSLWVYSSPNDANSPHWAWASYDEMFSSPRLGLTPCLSRTDKKVFDFIAPSSSM